MININTTLLKKYIILGECDAFLLVSQLAYLSQIINILINKKYKHQKKTIWIVKKQHKVCKEKHKKSHKQTT
jgi:hypothetical protein